jgi:DNA-binding transcriptional MocR family regulator
MARTTPPDHSPTEGGPLYRRIATQLLGELHDGTIPPGERLPAERQLAEHFGVSRETVRQALELLRRDGLVATDRRGSHATLPGPPVEHPAPGPRTPAPRPWPPSPGSPRRRSTPKPSDWPRTGRRWCTATAPRPPTAMSCARL